jgi:hypothetical protein
MCVNPTAFTSDKGHSPRIWWSRVIFHLYYFSVISFKNLLITFSCYYVWLFFSRFLSCCYSKNNDENLPNVLLLLNFKWRTVGHCLLFSHWPPQTVYVGEEGLCNTSAIPFILNITNLTKWALICPFLQSISIEMKTKVLNWI